MGNNPTLLGEGTCIVCRSTRNGEEERILCMGCGDIYCRRCVEPKYKDSYTSYAPSGSFEYYCRHCYKRGRKYIETTRDT